MKVTFIAAILTSALALGACVQEPVAEAPASTEPPAPPSRAITESMEVPYNIVKGYLTKAAEQASDKIYAFRATPEVRTFGQILAHAADGNYMFCGASSGEAGPGSSVEQTMTTKADIQKALADSFAFCDRAFAAVNDQTGAEPVTVAMMNDLPSTKLAILGFATAHQFEHYGNLVTYLRLNKMVPPSSQPM